MALSRLLLLLLLLAKYVLLLLFVLGDARLVDEENAGKVIDVVISDVDTVRPTTIMIRMVGLTAHSDRKLWLQAGEKMNISLRDPDTSGIARVTVVSVPINTLKELNEVCLNL